MSNGQLEASPGVPSLALQIFNAWTATEDEAWDADDRSVVTRLWARPIGQYRTVQLLHSMRTRIVAGHGETVLEAVAQCAMSDLVMPEWLALEFMKRYRAVTHAHVGSWDDPKAFGQPFPKGTQLAALRRRRKNRVEIARLVSDFVRAHPDSPLDPQWEEFGRQIGEGRTNAQELYREALELNMAFPASQLRKEMGWPELPAKIRKFAGRRRTV